MAVAVPGFAPRMKRITASATVAISNLVAKKRREGVDIMVAMNAETYAEDIASLKPGGYLVYDNSKSLSSSKSSWAAEWHHVVASFDGTTMRLYVAGALDRSQATTFTPSTNALGLLIGTTFGSQMKGGSSEAFDGILDEVRISNVARPAGWITTEYNNQSSPETFATFSSLPSAPTGVAAVEDVLTFGGPVQASNDVHER